MEEKFYITCSYEQREKAKAMGARWDTQKNNGEEIVKIYQLLL